MFRPGPAPGLFPELIGGTYDGCSDSPPPPIVIGVDVTSNGYAGDGITLALGSRDEGSSVRPSERNCGCGFPDAVELAALTQDVVDPGTGPWGVGGAAPPAL